MAGSKQKSMKDQQFAKGGSGSMFGKTTTGTQKPSAAGASRKSGGKGITAKGGSGSMFGKTEVKPAKKE